MRGRVDGLIVMAPDLDADARRWSLPPHCPVTLLNCPPDAGAFAGFTLANFEGARAMVRHLGALGHRRIAFIGGAPGNFDAAERRRGYRAGLQEAGLPADPALELGGDFSEAAGHAAAQIILGMSDRPTAVFAANDCMAIGAMSAFRDAGLRVPGDVALGGFDDIPMARYVEPPLTSVHVDICALGERAAACLLDELREPAGRASRLETLPTTLVVRRSCGAPRG
jgi:LacI family transcriptional regulator